MGPSNIQQPVPLAQPSVSQPQVSQQGSGKFSTYNFIATTSATSLINNSEELGMLIAGKKTKLSVSAKKSTDEKQSQRNKKTEAINPQNIINDASFAEEKASLVRLIKKFSRNEDLTEEDNEKIDELLDGMKDDANAAAEQFLVKAIDIIDREGRRNELGKDIEKIESLRRMLEEAKENNQKVDDQFWAGMTDLPIFSESGKHSGEISRKYAESLGGMSARLSDEYGTDNHQVAVAVEVKKIGYEVGQAKNNPERLLVLGKEMHLLQTYCTFDEQCKDSEVKIGRTHHYTIQEAGLVIRNNNRDRGF